MNRRTFTLSALAFTAAPSLTALSSDTSDLYNLYSAILTDALHSLCFGLKVDKTGAGICDWQHEYLLVSNQALPLTETDRNLIASLPLHREKYPSGPTPTSVWERQPTDTTVPAELLEAFTSRQQQPVHLRSSLHLPVPYSMATHEDAKGFGETHSMVLQGITMSTPRKEIERQQRVAAKYGPFTAYIQLSDAVFNPSHTLALATLHHNSGSDAIEPSWLYIMEKAGGQWRRYATPTPMLRRS